MDRDRVHQTDTKRLDDLKASLAMWQDGNTYGRDWEFFFPPWHAEWLLQRAEELEQERKRVWEAGSTLAHAFAFPKSAKKEHKREAMREFGYDEPEWWE